MKRENFKRTISFACQHCHAFQTIILQEAKKDLIFPCGQCQKQLIFNHLDQEHVKTCPVCSCKDLHQHKDFNKTIGLGIFLVGATLAPWTYYASLFAALALDAMLYPFFPWMIACYQCKAEIKGWSKNPKLDRFNHEMAAHYEYRKKSA